MYSSLRWMRVVLTCGLGAVILGGCGLRLGDGPPAGTLKLNSSRDAACLSGGGTTMADFLEGTATDEQIGGLWDCARRSIQLFGERTQGARTGTYTPQELRYFLEKHFLANYKISDGLLTEAMELKRNLLGGRIDSLTLSELKQLQRLLDLFKHHSLALRPFMPLTPDRLANVDPENLSQAVHALEAAAIDLGAILKGRGYQYPFTRLDQLFREVEAMNGQSEYRSRVGYLRSQLPLIRHLKALLVSPDSTLIEGGEWDTLLLSAAQGYGLVLRLAHLFKNHTDFTRGAGLEATKEVFKNFHAMLERAVLRRPEKLIPTLELEQFVYLIHPEENDLVFLGHLVPKSHLREMVRILIQRALGGARPGPEGRDAKGLTLPALKRMSDLFTQWAEGQSYLESLLKEPVKDFQKDSAQEELQGSARTRPDLLQAAQAMEAQALWVGASDPVAELEAARLRKLITWEKPYFYGDEVEIDFGRLQSEEKLGFTWGGLSKMHWMDLLSRLLMTAYSESAERAERGDRINFAELERFYTDFRTLGIDIRLFDPVSTDVVQKRFLEANLFMLSADGSGFLSGGKMQGWLTVDVARQFLADLISGKTLAYRLHHDVAARCPGGPKASKDYYGSDLVEAGCFRETFYPHLQEYWRRFPALANYFIKAPLEEKVGFACRIELIARREGFSETSVDSSDTESLGTLPHYIENLFLRFDRDSSGTLNWHEAVDGEYSAFGVFRNVMAEAVHQETGKAPSEKRLKAIFTFYLANGHKPTTSEYLKWYGRHYNPIVRAALGDWDFEADRGMLVRMLADFSSHAGAAAAASTATAAAQKASELVPDQQERACRDYWAGALARNPDIFTSAPERRK